MKLKLLTVQRHVQLKCSHTTRSTGKRKETCIDTPMSKRKKRKNLSKIALPVITVHGNPISTYLENLHSKFWFVFKLEC